MFINRRGKVRRVMMTWNIVTNSNDCDWLFIAMPRDMKSGSIERLCSHPESESMFCAEETCPKKLTIAENTANTNSAKQ